MQTTKYTISIIVIILTWIGLRPCWAQPESYNHPELDWYTIETEHFNVHFHNGVERTAKKVSEIAEEVFEPITSLYQYKPKGKYHFIIRDHDDYSNGAAFFYDNKIEIWATSADFEFRGSHNWLRNVVTHEFTHMIQLQSSRKITQKIPAFYFQAIGYEDDRRDDVLHGGPNVIASYPIAMTVMPGWFAEGVAQYQLPGLGYDKWDSHRDMILRTAALDNKLLTYNEMGVFGKNSLGNEKVYNHGYNFVSFLAENYGIETLRKVAHNMKGFFRLTLDGALKKATGKSARDLYSDWTNSLRSRYDNQMRDILANKVVGETVASKGIANFHPNWSPDGSKLAYITNQGNDYASQTSLVVKEMASGELMSVVGGVRNAFSWSPDGTTLAYSNKSARSKGGSRYFDLYIYDFRTKKKQRITKALRAHSPNWSDDGTQLVFIVNKDGTENLAALNLESKKVIALTDFKNGEQINRPVWSPNGQSILYSMFLDHGHNIFLFDLASKQSTPFVNDDFDSRDAVFDDDGNKIYFSWDKTGIFNIYSKDLNSNQTEQLTNVVGGAFMPSVNQDGTLAFSNFTSDGYKISVLKNPQPIEKEKTKYLTYQNGVELTSTQPLSGNYSNNSIGSNYNIKPYKSHYSPISFLPRLMIDYGTLKIGTYLYSSDVLDKYGFLAGFDVNRHGDYDLFALINYRNFGPTLFLEAYNQVQNTSIPVDSVESIRRGIFEKTSDTFRYNLMQVNAGASFKLSDSKELRTSFVFSRYGARARFQEAVGQSSFSYTYFIGRDFSIKFTHRNFLPSVHSDINPTGRYFSIGYDREFNKFLVGFEVNDAFLNEVFDNHNYNKFTFDWKEYLRMPIKDHTFNVDLQAGFIDTKVDSFFNFFAGGILGNRGYPFFSIEGRKMLQGRFTYRFPLFRHLDMRLMHLYFDKVFLGAFFDYGNAFNESSINLSDFKSSAGVQLRLDSYSFYSFPTRIFFNAAYGFNQFETANQIYGKEWRFYFGITFGYFD